MSNLFLWHGIFLQFSWCLMGLAQFGVNRYCKKYWWLHMWAHRIIGTLMTLFTYIFGILAIKSMGKVSVGFHEIVGCIYLAFTGMLLLGGVATRSILRRSTWNTPFALRFKMMHRTFGYLLLFLGQVQIQVGGHDYGTNPKHITD